MPAFLYAEVIMKSNVHTSNESKDPLLSINQQIKTNKKVSAGLTGSFNALIPNIQKIAEKYKKADSKASSQANSKR